jgi:hypothetical protein
MSNDETSWRLTGKDAPPREVTAELFAERGAARRGKANPERMANPVWTWLARRPEINPYQAGRHFSEARTEAGYPGWTNCRFGQSITTLLDGLVLAVAGEHEDWYDPDFFIYNDVIATAPNGTVEIFGYTTDAFPPTDFHSATLAGDHLYLIGNLGYAKDRSDRTQVLRLDVRSMAVEQLMPTGESPGWLSHHAAILGAEGRTIRVTGGRIHHSMNSTLGLVYAVDDYVLDLTDLVWTRVTDRGWRQYRVARAEGIGQLWGLNQLAEYSKQTDEWSRSQAADYRDRLNPDVDLAAWNARYRPPVPYEAVTDDPEEWRTHRIRLDGTTVRYVEGQDDITIVVEGPLPAATETAVVGDLRDKLTRAEAAEYTITHLDPAG